MKKSILIMMTVAALISLPAVSYADPGIPPGISPVPEASTFYAGAALLLPLSVAVVNSMRKRRQRK